MKHFTLKSKNTRELNPQLLVGNIYFDFVVFHHLGDGAVVEFLYYYLQDDNKVQVGGTANSKQLSTEEIEYLQSLTTPSATNFIEITREFYINGAFAVLEQEKNFGWGASDWELVAEN